MVKSKRLIKSMGITFNPDGNPRMALEILFNDNAPSDLVSETKCPDCGAVMTPRRTTKRLYYECPTESCSVISVRYDKDGQRHINRQPLKNG